MKAVTRTKYGGPEVLEVRDIPQPEPKDDEILVRVHATTVNRTDCGILTATPFPIRFFTGLFKPKSLVPGTDFAGVVVAIGEKVTNFRTGDRVWGLNDEGLASHAEYLVIKEDAAVIPIPENIDFEEAVACAEGGHYAFNFLNKVKLVEGSEVLVNGATGAIGSSALQQLKSRNIYITAVGNTKNLKLLEQLGADKVLNYEEVDFTEADDEQYDFIFDAVGKSSYSKSKKLLKRNGIYISSELGPGAENLYLHLITKIRGGKRVIFPIPIDRKRSLLHLKELFENGYLQAVIDRKYSVEEIQDAYRYVLKGQKTGSVLIVFYSDD